ncbi:hypothetical protein N866_13530 [Actinotalea ferrariae CF5-4]|uniref:Uncharacterized protein n=1 Tax=Actinotalea ferrariae CF5-4 TaxID=948458 RepID=A0A021VYW0_9CELL|nr:hypothetical protein [Actinotalea ferrariae]EYR64267.1 hypothetical protein N866_13530 [Actinotalea ferrariae CF5-4]
MVAVSVCPESAARAAMGDGEFWEHVLQRPGHEFEVDGPDLEVQVSRDPCPECGEPGACAWDSEGRPLIHASDGADL